MWWYITRYMIPHWEKEKDKYCIEHRIDPNLNRLIELHHLLASWDDSWFDFRPFENLIHMHAYPLNPMENVSIQIESNTTLNYTLLRDLNQFCLCMRKINVNTRARQRPITINNGNLERTYHLHALNNNRMRQVYKFD